MGALPVDEAMEIARQMALEEQVRTMRRCVMEAARPELWQRLIHPPCPMLLPLRAKDPGYAR